LQRLNAQSLPRSGKKLPRKAHKRESTDAP